MRAVRGCIMLGRSKYGAIKTIVDGYRFDSKAEAERYAELKWLLAAKEIVALELQPEVKLPCGVKYRGDFLLTMPDGSRVIEDVKGMRTPVYRLKMRMLKNCPCHTGAREVKEVQC